MVPAFHELNIAVVRKCTVCIDLKFCTISRATPVIAYCGVIWLEFKYYTDFLTTICKHLVTTPSVHEDDPIWIELNPFPDVARYIWHENFIL